MGIKAQLKFILATILLVESASTNAVLAESWKALYDLTPAQFALRQSALAWIGFRPVSITVHTGPAGPVFQVTWVKDGVSDWASAYGQNWDEFQAFAAQQAALDRRPLSVASYGVYPSEQYVSVWAPRNEELWEARYRMTPEEYGEQLTELAGVGLRPYWVSATDGGDGPLYSALWVFDEKGSFEIHDQTDANFSESLNAIRAGGYRLISATSYSSAFISVPEFGGVCVYWEQPEWDYFHGQTRSQLDATTAIYLADGYRPTFVNAYETTMGRRYTSAWEKIPQVDVWTVRGPEVPELAGFDSMMQQFMSDRHIRNASLAVTKDGRLVLARGYTWAPEGWPITVPTTRFRLASLSKTLTAVGIMKLIDSGLISIDQSIDTLVDTSRWKDPRIHDVTIRQLLQHWGGWDTQASGVTALTDDFQVSQLLNMPLPTTPQMILNYMATKTLDTDPGTHYAYSNFGYFLLGQIIEATTSRPYEDWMRETIFAPIQIYGPRIANSLAENQWPGEPPYVDAYQRVTESVMGSDSPEYTPLVYGGFNIHTMSSAGGWISSAVDYVRFLTAFDSLDFSPLLSHDSFELMWSRPPGLPADTMSYYAAGWWVDRLTPPELVNASNGGTLTGTSTGFGRRYDGVDWVVLFNTEGAENLPPMSIGIPMDELISATTVWPDHDLFATIQSGDMNCDTLMTYEDVDRFVESLSSPEEYASQYSDCPLIRGDMNGDGLVNGSDIQGFVDKFISAN